MNDPENFSRQQSRPDSPAAAQTHTDEQPVVVLFDGQCPLCSREIAHYRRRKGADRIEWLDVTRRDVDPDVLGVSREAALARFHVRDPAGDWRTGAAAFVLLWSRLPAYRWLATLASGLRLVPVMEWAYVRFLRWRSRDRCDSDRCHRGT